MMLSRAVVRARHSAGALQAPRAAASSVLPAAWSSCVAARCASATRCGCGCGSAASAAASASAVPSRSFHASARSAAAPAAGGSKKKKETVERGPMVVPGQTGTQRKCMRENGESSSTAVASNRRSTHRQLLLCSPRLCCALICWLLLCSRSERVRLLVPQRSEGIQGSQRQGDLAPRRRLPRVDLRPDARAHLGRPAAGRLRITAHDLSEARLQHAEKTRDQEEKRSHPKGIKRHCDRRKALVPSYQPSCAARVSLACLPSRSILAQPQFLFSLLNSL